MPGRRLCEMMVGENTTYDSEQSQCPLNRQTRGLVQIALRYSISQLHQHCSQPHRI